MKNGFFGGFIEYWSGVGRSIGSLYKGVSAGLSYLRLRSESRKEVTEQYPDPVSSRSPEELPPRTRGRLVNDILKCTGCGDCQAACPTACIRVVSEDGPKPGKKWVATFDIDHSKCIFCGLCVEVCHPQSLTHARQHQTATTSLAELVTSFGRGPVSPALRDLWAKQREQGERGDFF